MSYHPDRADWLLNPRHYARMLALTRLLAPYFRPTWSGLEVLRGDRGMLLVANHGLLGLDLPLLQLGIHDFAGRPLRSFSDRVLFVVPPVRAALTGMGVCEGTPAVAQRVLARGELAFTCPGGAREALAPKRDRYKLQWAGRYGFVRSAIRAGAPIVPVAILGSAETYHQLADAETVRRTALGRLIARHLGEKYVPPLYLGLGPLPLPQRMRFFVGEPIEVPADPALANDETTVRDLHARAQRQTERLLGERMVSDIGI